MQQLTTTPSPLARWSLWIDRLHRHRLVELVDIVDGDSVRLQPIPESSERSPSYLESTGRLLGPDYEQLRPAAPGHMPL
jgi:hypothetical protein